jgi:hypothetical protein
LTSGNAAGGSITLTPGAGIGTGAAGMVLFGSGTNTAGVKGNNYAVRSDAQYTFVSSTDISANNADTGIAKNAAGVVRVTNGSTSVGSLLTARLVEANTAGVGSPNILAFNESRTLLTNEGVTAMNHHTLPAATTGLEYLFYVQDADGITITAGAGDTIRVAGSVSSAAGTAANSTIGGFIQLIAINATEWVAGATQGTWTLT